MVEADVDGVVQLPGGEVLGLGNPGAITIVPNTMGSNTMGSNTMKTLKVAILSPHLVFQDSSCVCQGARMPRYGTSEILLYTAGAVS